MTCYFPLYFTGLFLNLRQLKTDPHDINSGYYKNGIKRKCIGLTLLFFFSKFIISLKQINSPRSLSFSETLFSSSLSIICKIK